MVPESDPPRRGATYRIVINRTLAWDPRSESRTTAEERIMELVTADLDAQMARIVAAERGRRQQHDREHGRGS